MKKSQAIELLQAVHLLFKNGVIDAGTAMSLFDEVVTKANQGEFGEIRSLVAEWKDGCCTDVTDSDYVEQVDAHL